jgi:hypothetical protein
MVERIIETLSPRRFQVYLKESGYNKTRAVQLHVWNAQLGASFHIIIQAVEVALRNKICSAFMSKFGPDWWKNEDFIKIVDEKRKSDIKIACDRLSKKGVRVQTDEIIAGLSFGFWGGMLHKQYNPTIQTKTVSNIHTEP